MQSFKETRSGISASKPTATPTAARINNKKLNKRKRAKFNFSKDSKSVPKPKSDIPKSKNDIPKPRSDVPKPRSDIPKPRSGPPQRLRSAAGHPKN